MLENLRPRPVRVTTPTIMPALAQVEATPRTPMEPAFKALINLGGVKAVSRRKKLTPKAIMVAQKTDMMGVNPKIMRATMAIREVK